MNQLLSPGVKTEMERTSVRSTSDALNSNSSRLRQLVYLRDVFFLLLDRDMKVMYKRSALGIVWTLITPLLQLIVYSFLFSCVLSVKVDHYASFAFTGLLAWNWFQLAVQAASRSTTDSGSLLVQPNFPSAILPPAAVATWLLHFLLALPALGAVLLINGVTLGPTALLLPIVIAVQFAFTVALAYPLSAVSVTFRDTNHILTILLNLAISLTPIFYSIDVVPERYRWFFDLNPIWHLIKAYRAVLIEGRLPDFASLAIPLLVAAVVFPVGYWFFRRQSGRFVEEL